MKVDARLKAGLFLLFVVGLGTIFPYASHLARGDGIFEFNFIDYVTNSGDFDGFQSFLNVIIYTNDKAFMFGGQLVGAILAFVPRVIWPGKAEATGLIAAEHMGYQFTNISSPLISEIFIDFGYIGIPLLGALLGVALRKMDYLSFAARESFALVTLFYLAIPLSFLIIIFRGALIAIVAPIYIELFLLYISLIFILRNKTRI